MNKLVYLGQRIIPQGLKRQLANSYHLSNNLLKHGTTDFFRTVEIETTTACNLRCSYCPNSKFDRGLIKNKKDIDLKLFKKIIGELSEIRYNGRISPHFYGEPLLDSRLVDLVKYAKKKIPSSSIVIYTNGELLTLNKYLLLIKAGVQEFVITQHLKRKSKNVSDVIEYRKNKGNDGVILYYESLDEKDLNNRGGLVSVKAKTMKSCMLPSNALTIDHTGNVILCCNDYLSSVVLGNINKEKIISIWNKPGYKQLRKDIRKGKFTLNLCKKCASGM